MVVWRICGRLLLVANLIQSTLHGYSALAYVVIETEEHTLPIKYLHNADIL